MDIRRILAELRAERDRIAQAITAIESLNSAGRRIGRRGRGAQATEAKPRRRRRMSAAARKRISAMMKARWAARKKAKAA